MDQQIWRRVASFLLAPETAALQNTCKMFLQWRMSYFFEQLDSMTTVLKLHLAKRTQSVTIKNAETFASGDLAAAVLLGQQIHVQIQQIVLDGDESFDPFVLDMFLQSTCAKDITLFAEDVTLFADVQQDTTFIRHVLQFPNVVRVFVNVSLLSRMVERHNITDERLCARQLRIDFDYDFDNERLLFFLSRLDQTITDTVTFHAVFPLTTTQRIVNFCAIIVSNFTSRHLCCRFHFGLDVVLGASDDYQSAINAVDKMLETLHSYTGHIALHNRQTLSVIREW
jgi:hypothetical protein